MSGGGDHGSGTVDHRTYTWDFGRHGPTFTDKKGEPLPRQPMRGPAWEAFQAWLKQRDHHNE